MNNHETSTTTNKPQLNRAALMIILVVAAFAGLHMTVSANGAPKSTKTYQQQLQSEVETDYGSPRDGRNPASQTQTSLAYAASQPAGPGQQVDKPAAAVVGSHSHHVDPKTVLPDTRNTGVVSGGCLLGYGQPGEKCVQVGKAQPANGAKLTGNLPLNCDPSQTLALQGILLNSTDPFNRPAASDKAACNVTQL
jgi:hypothetical protein